MLAMVQTTERTKKMQNPCFNCEYHWQQEWENYPSCHYEGPYEWSPCEAIERELQEYEEFVRGEMEYYDEH